MYKNKLFDTITINKICDLHVNDSLNPREIGELYKCSRLTITRILKSEGVYTSQKPYLKSEKHPCWEDSVAIEKLYVSGLSTTTIAKQYTCSHKTIIDILQSRECDRRDSSEARQEYFYDKHVFNVIDSEEKAYWLGFMYADGSVYGNNVAIGLHVQDETHLLKFKNFTKYPGELRYPKLDTVSIAIVNKFMANDLIDKGCFRKKSSILKFPTEQQVPKHLISHFMRGYFDGDGCLSRATDNRYGFSILGTLEFTSKYQEILIENCKCNRTKLGQRHKDRDNNNYTMVYGGRNSINNILDFLYKDATIYLDRKYHKYQEFKQVFKSMI